MSTHHHKDDDHHLIEQPLDPHFVRVTDEANWRTKEGARVLNKQYVRGSRIGKGQHGHVWIAYDLNNGGRTVAIKVVKRNNPREEKQRLLRKGATSLPMSSNHTALTARVWTTEIKIKKEIAIMKKLRHSNVVRLIEIIDDKLSKTIYMVMEYLAGGELRWRTPNDEPVLTVYQTRRTMRDVMLGLEYLHYQGIIHRDIKPANLVWDERRATVKITDFGVSHFSYAQRLSAAGQARAQADDPCDPILLDDSDLTKRAGTPFYLAPEVVWSDWDDTINTATTERPKITSQIDLWAFGVTLFSLLEGRTPFTIPEDRPQHEFQIYRIVCTEDWDMPPTMGADAIPTGGRHPTDRDSQGYMVVNLLDRLLQKDPMKRITIDELKRHPWFLHDIADPEKWLRETSPSRDGRVEVTDADGDSAINSMEFSSWDRLSRRLSSLWRIVYRPLRSTSRRQLDPVDEVGVESAPIEHVKPPPRDISRRKSTTGITGPWKKEKGVRRSSSRPSTAISKGSPARRTVSRPSTAGTTPKEARMLGPSRSKSVDRGPLLKGKSPVATVALTGSSPKARRGSENLTNTQPRHFSRPSEPVPGDHSRRGGDTSVNAQMRQTTRSSEPGSSDQSQRSHDIRRLFGFWRPRKVQGTSLDTSTATSSCHDPGIDSPVSGNEVSTGSSSSRQSVEVIVGPPIAADVTAPRRVWSWTVPGYRSDDGITVHSHSCDDISERVMLEGAGGVSESGETFLEHQTDSPWPQNDGGVGIPQPGIRIEIGDDPYHSDDDSSSSSMDDGEGGSGRLRFRRGRGDDGDDSDDGGIVVLRRLQQTPGRAAGGSEESSS